MNTTADSPSQPNTQEDSPVPPPPNPVGRPSDYTPKRLDAVCQFIRHTGLSDTACAALAEVTEASLGRWRKKHEEVQMRLDQARAQYQCLRLEQIGETRLKNGELDWRAQAWLVKFPCPEKYGAPSRRRRLQDVEVPLTEEEQLAAAAAKETADTAAAVAGWESYVARKTSVVTPEMLVVLQKWRMQKLERLNAEPTDGSAAVPAAPVTPQVAPPENAAPREVGEKCDNSLRNSPPPPEPRMSRRARRAEHRALRREAARG